MHQPLLQFSVSRYTSEIILILNFFLRILDRWNLCFMIPVALVSLLFPFLSIRYPILKRPRGVVLNWYVISCCFSGLYIVVKKCKKVLKYADLLYILETVVLLDRFFVALMNKKFKRTAFIQNRSFLYQYTLPFKSLGSVIFFLSIF